MLIPGKPKEFKIPKSVTVLFPGGHVYEFQGVVSVSKAEDGTLFLTKNNDGEIEVPPGYLFFEVGDIEDDQG